MNAWARSTYTAESYEGVRQTAAYRGDLHILVEAPDGTMARGGVSDSTPLSEFNARAMTSRRLAHPTKSSGFPRGQPAP